MDSNDLKFLYIIAYIILLWIISYIYIYTKAMSEFKKQYGTKNKEGWQWQQFTEHREAGASLKNFIHFSKVLIILFIISLIFCIIIN